MNKLLEIKCVQCKEKFFYHQSKFLPFCSERCKEIDLGVWLTEGYSIPGEETHENGEVLGYDEDEE